jgi:flagellar motor component MotA
MDNVQFDEENMPTPISKPEVPSIGISGYLIRKGYVATRSEARLIISLASIAIIFGASILIFVSAFNSPNKVPYQKVPTSIKRQLPPDARKLLEQQNIK